MVSKHVRCLVLFLGKGFSFSLFFVFPLFGGRGQRGLKGDQTPPGSRGNAMMSGCSRWIFFVIQFSAALDGPYAALGTSTCSWFPMDPADEVMVTNLAGRGCGVESGEAEDE